MNSFELHDRCADPVTDRLSAYFSRFFILTGQKNLQFSILDTERNMFISLADFRLKSMSVAPVLYAANLRQLMTDDENFHRKYSAVTIGIDSPVHTLVPSAMFDREKLRHYLRFNFQLQDEYKLFYDYIPEVDAYNIYAIEPTVSETLHGFFPEAALVHAGSSLVRVFYQHHQASRNATSLYLHIRENEIDLCCFGENGLQFFNSFTCQGKEDVLYFTLYAMDQLRLRLESTPVSISGFLDKGTDTFSLLSQYIPLLSLATRPGPAIYSPVFQSMPAHHYLQLFGLALCAS